MQPPHEIHIPPDHPRRTVRWPQIFVGAVIGLLFARLWLIQGLFVPVIVDSGSMAPTLDGPHRAWDCVDCGRPFVCNLSSLPAGDTTICPNCGVGNEAAKGIERSGDRVLVDRAAFLWRSPRRWETVVFRAPHAPAELTVKRIAGLPGEAVEIRDGDLFVDELIVQKSAAELRAMAIPVYRLPQDEAHAAAAEPRWRAEPAGAWKQQGDQFVHDKNETGKVDWLVYHHRQGFDARGPNRSGPIVDESICDQAESRELNVVRDVLLCCQLRADGPGTVHLRAKAGADTFEFQFDLERREGRLSHNGEAVSQIRSSRNVLATTTGIEWMLADHQVQLVVGGQLALKYAYDPQPAAGEPSDESVALGATAAEVTVRDLEVLRDIYYTAAPQTHPAQPSYRLGTDEYLLLGDNSPHAVDSRVWLPESPIKTPQIVGRALSW